MPTIVTDKELRVLMAQLEDHPLVEKVWLEPATRTGFAADPELIGGLVLAFMLREFGEALVGRAADGLWTLLRRVVVKLRAHLRTAPLSASEQPLSVKYIGRIGPRTVELEITYESLDKLRSDLRNHRQYAALAFGFAARDDGALEHDLCDLLPPEQKTNLAGIALRDHHRHD